MAKEGGRIEHRAGANSFRELRARGTLEAIFADLEIILLKDILRIVLA
jgi:hypothetical protein